MKTTKIEGDKISKGELDEILKLENTKRSVLIRIGELESDKLNFLDILKQVLLQQKEIKGKLNKKYGKINIDLNTGQYVKDVTPEAEEPKKKLEIVE